MQRGEALSERLPDLEKMFEIRTRIFRTEFTITRLVNWRAIFLESLIIDIYRAIERLFFISIIRNCIIF